MWGSKFHKSDNLEYEGYGLHLRGIIFSFLVDNYYTEDLSLNLDDFFEEIDNHPNDFVSRCMSLNSDRVVDSPESGMYSLEYDEIWMKFLPEKELTKLKTQLKSELGDNEVDNILISFIYHYNSINHLDKSERTWRRFLSTLEHKELTDLLQRNQKLSLTLLSPYKIKMNQNRLRK